MNRKEREHLGFLERRRDFLIQRIQRAGTYPKGSFDKAEANALDWAVRKLREQAASETVDGNLKD